MDPKEIQHEIVDTKTLLDDEQKAQAEASIRSVVRRCRGPIAPNFLAAKNALLEEGRNDEASEMDHRGRLNPLTGGPSCTKDLNDIIVALPWDGVQRVIECPNCKEQRKVQTPTFQPK